MLRWSWDGVRGPMWREMDQTDFSTAFRVSVWPKKITIEMDPNRFGIHKSALGIKEMFELFRRGDVHIFKMKYDKNPHHWKSWREFADWRRLGLRDDESESDYRLFVKMYHNLAYKISPETSTMLVVEMRRPKKYVPGEKPPMDKRNYRKMWGYLRLLGRKEREKKFRGWQAQAGVNFRWRPQA
ncbi:hypothetical protein TWF694_007846 [Orbilia ellipsospora]|uniref:Uncharacterized protein n=1 Tax=Orbilia ellipsospora TaxID=2528407 RepID=A0AAV9XMB9_9PEZI